MTSALPQGAKVEFLCFPEDSEGANYSCQSGVGRVRSMTVVQINGPFGSCDAVYVSLSSGGFEIIPAYMCQIIRLL